MEDIRLTQYQTKFINLLNDFISSNYTNLFMQHINIGFHFALLYFIKNLNEDVVVYTYTKRRAQDLFKLFLEFIPMCQVIKKGPDTIEYINNNPPNTPTKKFVSFIDYKSRGVGRKVLNIYTHLLYDEFKFDSGRFITKTIWFVQTEIEPEVIKKHNGLSLYLK